MLAGMETTPSCIVVGPKQIVVAAPLRLLFDIVSKVDYGYRPHGEVHVFPVQRTGNPKVIAFVGGQRSNQQRSYKEMRVHAPDRFSFLHLDGLLAGTAEDMHLSPAANGTVVHLKAVLPRGIEDSAGVLTQSIEQHMRSYLVELRATAEHRHGVSRSGAERLGSLGLLPSERVLQFAVEEQEEIEYGHSGHGKGVARIALGLAELIGLPARRLEHLQRAALLHDAGKLALDSALWGVRGALRDEERTQLEVHARFGVELAAEAGLPDPVLQTILHHHERWDGAGYPYGLSGDNIPMHARILFLAEVIDTGLRTSYRRSALAPEQVSAVLEAGAGRLWDPALARKAAQMVRGHNPPG